MKIIDLLNRIAKDEGIPIKIKFKGKEYEWSQEFYDYRDIDIIHSFLVENLETEDLNRTCEEIPLIEEDKKIEKIIPTSLKGIDNLDEKIEIAHIDTISAIEKINEIIDVINKGDK